MTRHRAKGRERGSTAIVVAVMMVGLLMTVGMAVNVGHLLSVRGELQNGVDAAALAGAVQLDGSAGKLTPSRQAASAFAQAHMTDGQFPLQSVVQLAAWDPATRTCAIVTGTDQASAQRINAVYVTATHDEPVFLSSFLQASSTSSGAPACSGAALEGGSPGGATVTAGARALAVTGGPCDSRCGDLPFVIQLGCVLGKCDPGVPDTERIYFIALATDTNDTAGFTNLLPAAGVSSGDICGILTDPQYCADHRSDPRPGFGDTIYTSNGAQWSAQCQGTQPRQSICDIIQSRVGESARLPAIMYPGDTETTCNAQYNQSATIQGFVTMKTLLARCKRNGVVSTDSSVTPQQQAAWVSACDSAAGQPQQCVVMQQQCNVTDTEPSESGCKWLGTSVLYPKLAK
jgi:Flp pilus assembly protein TadG